MPTSRKPEGVDLAEARKREALNALNEIFNGYDELIFQISDVSVSLGKIVEKIVVLDKAMKQLDPSGDMMLSRRLRMKVILGIVFPARQHLDRLSTRMKACISNKGDLIVDFERPETTFE